MVLAAIRKLDRRKELAAFCTATIEALYGKT